MEDASKQAAQAAKETAGSFSSFVTGYAKDATKVIRTNVEGQLSDTVTKLGQVSDATKEKMQQAVGEAEKKAEAVLGEKLSIAAQVIKDKTEETKKIAMEKLDAAAKMSREHTERAAQSFKEKMAAAAGVAEDKAKEFAKTTEEAIKNKASEASQAIKGMTEQQLTKMLAALKDSDVAGAKQKDKEEFVKACKTVCTFEESNPREAMKCEINCLQVKEMKEEVLKMAKQIETQKSGA